MAMTGGTSYLIVDAATVEGGYWVKLYLYVKYTQSVAENSTTFSLGMYINSQYEIGTWSDIYGSYVGTSTSGDGCIPFDGTVDYGKGVRWICEDIEVTVPHNADGSKTARIYWKLGVNAYKSYIVGFQKPSGYVDIALPAIARASVPTLSAYTARMGNVLTINTNRKSSAFTHMLTYTFGGTTATIATGVGASYTWTVPDLASKCDNDTSGTVTISCVTYNGNTKIGTKTVTATLMVPSATVPFFPNGNVIIGAGNPITTNAGSSNFSHLITYSFHGMAGNVNNDKEKSGIVWWTPYALASAIPSDTSGTGTITCTTYNGTAVVGSNTVSFTARVPNDDTTKPKLTSMTLVPSGSIPSAFSGLFIQGKTGIKATFTGESEYSEVESYKMTVEGKVYKGNPATSDVLTNSGNVEVVGTVYDERGYYDTIPQDVMVYPYSIPWLDPYDGLSSIVCERSTSDKTYSDKGTYLHIKCKRGYAPIKVDEVQKNFCHIRYRYKAEGGSWSQEMTLLSGSDLTTDQYDAALPDIVTQTDTSYAVQLIVTDTMGELIRYDFSIPTAIVTLHLKEGGKGVAIGKYAEEDDKFECEWDGQFNGNLFANHIARRGLYDSLDFDELIYHTGYYTGTQAPSTVQAANYPIDLPGALVVISTMEQNATTQSWLGFAFQAYCTHMGDIYTRSYDSSGGLTVWKKITTT